MSKVTFDLSKQFDLFLTGDFCPYDPVANSNLKIDEKLLAQFKQAKIRAVNLECPITQSNNYIEKTGPVLRSDPIAIDLLARFEVNFCDLANNHSMDYGHQGATDTQKYLREAGIAYAGVSSEPQEDIAVMDCNGKKIAFVTFTENEFSTFPENGISATPIDHYIQLKQIIKAREHADYIIVLYHGGAESYPLPTPGQKRYARYLADLGVSAVICHHSHCISGYETYHNVPIFYGLGNFYFPEKGNPDTWYRGLTLGITLKPELSMHIIPIRLDLESMTLSLDHQDSALNNLDQYNRMISSDDLLNQAWQDFCRKREFSTLCSLYNPPRLLRLLMKRGLIRNYMRRKINLCLLNNLRCETHREKLITTISYILGKSEDQ